MTHDAIIVRYIMLEVVINRTDQVLFGEVPTFMIYYRQLLKLFLVRRAFACPALLD
jgi:hypothetical protein